MKKIYGVCPHDCPDTCGFITEVENGRARKLYANPEHPVTDGWLCAKVRPYLNHVYHPDRLQYPLRRVGEKGGGQWQRISWEEAIGEIGERWWGIIAEYGAEAILPYSYSGTLGLVQMAVSSGRFWNRLGASQLQRAICGAAGEFAVTMTLGGRFAPPYTAVRYSKLIIIWGHNPVSTAPHFMPHLAAARRDGCRVVVIDPRRTRTAKQATWHIAPKPGTDGALALGLAHIIVREGWQDEAFLAAHTVGWPELRRRLDDYPSQRVAAITGLPQSDIEKLARMYAQTRPSLIKFADGVQRNPNGGQTVRAICALPAITGQYGRPGGGLMYTASDFVRWDGEAVGKRSQCPPGGRRVNMNRLGAALLGEVSDPPIQSLFVFGANPAASAPNTGQVIAGLRRPDLFTVVHELFMTDTAIYADIVLPATSQLEQTDLHKAYGHATLAYNAPAIPPPSECKSNWQVMRLLVAEMGFTEPWLRQSADEVIAEVLAATAVHNPALKGITLERLQAEHAIPLNVPAVPLANGRFPTPSGKIELYSQALADMRLDPLPGFAGVFDDGGVEDDGRFPPDETLNLISPAAHHFVSSSLANQAELRQREGEPFVEIHPDDAARQGIVDGDAVMVVNGRGQCQLIAQVTDAVRPGVLASPKGYWGGNVNQTTSDALADMAGQSTFHSNRVWLRKL